MSRNRTAILLIVDLVLGLGATATQIGSAVEG